MTPENPAVSYLDVSTDRQGQSGLGLDAQRTAITAFVAGRLVLGEFIEVESERKDDRHQLAAALALCRQCRAVLVIAKLDRLARSVAFISNLMASGVEFTAADMPQANRLTVHIMAAVAEHEREMIAQRTKAALAAAKARRTRLGNPRPDMAAARAVASGNATQFRAAIRPQIETLHAEGWSLRQIAAELNARGISSARNRSWHAASVRGILLSAESYIVYAKTFLTH